MYSKAIVTYSFSDDDVRSEFESGLAKWGLIPEPDQTTYSLPRAAALGTKILYNRLEAALGGFEFVDGEHVTMYWPAEINDGSLMIKRHIWQA